MGIGVHLSDRDFLEALLDAAEANGGDLVYLKTQIDELMGGRNPLLGNFYGITAVGLDQNATFGLMILSPEGANIPSADITGGAVSIRRIRSGVETVLVDSVSPTIEDGHVSYTYTFPSTHWQVDDGFRVTLQGVEAAYGGETYSYQTLIRPGKVANTPGIQENTDVIRAEVGNLSSNTLPAIQNLLEQNQLDLQDIKALAFGGSGSGATYDVVVDNNQHLESAVYGLAALKALLDAILADTGTDIPALLGTIDGVVDAILVDTGTNLPATLSAIKAKTDQLNFTGSNVQATVPGGVTVSAGGITANSIATDAITAAKVAADTVTKVQSGLATPESLRAVLGRELLSNVNMELSANWLGASGATVSRSNEQAFLGAYSYKVVSPGSNGALYQNFTTKKGARYYSRAWVYPTTTESIQLKLYDGVTWTTIRQQSCPANQWTAIEGFVTSTGASASGYVALYMVNGGTFYVDQFSCRLVDGDEALLQRALQALDTVVDSPTPGSLLDIMKDDTIWPWDNHKHSLQAIARESEVTRALLSPNLVKDPTGESLSNFSAGTLAHETTATRVRSGGKSLAFTGILTVHTVVPLKPNTDYLLEYWVHDPNSRINQTVNYFKLPSDLEPAIQIPPVEHGYGTNQWKQARTVVNVSNISLGTPTDAWFRLDLGVTTSPVYIDDISLREVSGGAAGRGEYWPDLKVGSYTCTGSEVTIAEFTDITPLELLSGVVYVTAPAAPTDDLTLKVYAQFTPGGTWRLMDQYVSDLPTTARFTIPFKAGSFGVPQSLTEGVYAFGWRLTASSLSSPVHQIEYSFGAKRKVR